jgi:endogenous inhibitor of DNA gyrase (YacG/DUF329 family)
MKRERCPICESAVTEATATTRPFCSERCRTIDLGNWLGESYRIPVVDETPPDDEAAAAATNATAADSDD